MPEKKKINLGLLPKLIAAIILGIVIGTIARKANLPIIIQIGATFNSIFGNFLGFCIPLIIIGFVAPGIADLGAGAWTMPRTRRTPCSPASSRWRCPRSWAS